MVRTSSRNKLSCTGEACLCSPYRLRLLFIQEVAPAIAVSNLNAYELRVALRAKFLLSPLLSDAGANTKRLSRSIQRNIPRPQPRAGCQEARRDQVRVRESQALRIKTVGFDQVPHLVQLGHLHLPK